MYLSCLKPDGLTYRVVASATLPLPISAATTTSPLHFLRVMITASGSACKSCVFRYSQVFWFLPAPLYALRVRVHT